MEEDIIANKTKLIKKVSFDLPNNSKINNSKKYKNSCSHIRNNLLEIAKEDIKNSSKLCVKSSKIYKNSLFSESKNEGFNNVNNVQNNANNEQNNINSVQNNVNIIENSPEVNNEEQTGNNEQQKYDNECSSSDISD